MTPEEYVATQAGLVAAAKAVAKLNLVPFLAQISSCETLAPIVDPTLYLRGSSKLERVKRLARAAMALRGELLAQVREDLGGVAEAAGLTDEEVAALITSSVGDPATEKAVS